MTTAHTELAALRDSLHALRSLNGGTHRVHEFSAQARRSHTLLETLPPRYREVLLGLLDRLESSALFAEESCSFSQTDLLDSLQMWLDKAQAQLAR